MSDNDFDKAGRACFNLDPPGILRWLLPGLSPACTFQRWFNARAIAFPGEADRICDTVAELLEAGAPPLWWLLVIEMQSELDANMFGRLLEYLGRLWRYSWSPQQTPQRYRMAAALVNFTGRGRSSRNFRLLGTAARTCLRIVEKNVAAESAALTLANIETGAWTRALLPLIPLMQGGKKAAMIQQWKTVAETEPDDRRRDEYASLARVFADLTGCRPIWNRELEGWNVKRSQQVMEWQAEAKADAVIEVLQFRFGSELPADIVERIRSTTDMAQIKLWLEAAVRADAEEVPGKLAIVIGPKRSQPDGNTALEGGNMKRSESVLEWQAEAKVKAKADAVIKVLRLRFGPDLPVEVEERIRGTTDLDQLDRWLEAAVRARTLKKFRQALET